VAKGVTHRWITLGVSGACLGTVLFAGPAVALPMTAGCLAGIWIEPDLDVEELTRSEYSLINSPAPISWLGWLWVLFWWPYGKLIRHRSPLSHWPVLGTALRLLYLSIPLLLFSAFTGGMPLLLLSPLLPFAPFLFAGLVLSDLAHWMADVL
jgi:uncharacterized metal-binding protein